jgi:hypothetical protein
MFIGANKLKKLTNLRKGSPCKKKGLYTWENTCKTIFKCLIDLLFKVTHVSIKAILILSVILSGITSGKDNLEQMLTSHINVNASYDNYENDKNYFVNYRMGKEQNAVLPPKIIRLVVSKSSTSKTEKKPYYSKRYYAGMDNGDQIKKEQDYYQSQDNNSEEESYIEILDETILNLKREITSKEYAINEYDERFERYEDLGNNRAANSELGKNSKHNEKEIHLKVYFSNAKTKKFFMD